MTLFQLAEVRGSHELTVSFQAAYTTQNVVTIVVKIQSCTQKDLRKFFIVF